jgi:FdhE protein
MTRLKRLQLGLASIRSPGVSAKLCVYSTPAFDGVRVEACDTCHAYIKTIDLTRNGLAVPEVDELASVLLTLWADEHGYRKVARNLISL